MSYDDFTKMQAQIRDERIATFKNAIKGMVATTDAAYQNTSRADKRGRTYYDYTTEDIHRIVTAGTSIEQAALSEYFFNTNGLYKRIVLHYATFLTYSWILVPYTKGYGKYKITDKMVSHSYYDASDFCTDFQIERKCDLFAKDILVKGAYYGLVIDEGNNLVVSDLPFDYCRSRFKNLQDIDIIEFNLDFFKKIRDDKLRKDILETYPRDIQKAYRRYVNDKGDKWYMIPADMGIYFNFFEERPFFLDLIPLLDALDDYKEIDRQRNIQALKRILVQEVPHDGMKLVFEPQEAESMHEGTTEMLANNPDIDVVTSYAKVSLLDMSSNDDKKTEISDMQNLIYSSAGMSKELFFATTAAGIQYSVSNDLALVMILGYKFAHYLTYLINRKFENKKVKYKLVILPLSYYNCAEYTSRAKEMATLGYSFLTPVLSTGIDQTNLANLKTLENDLLEFDTILKPLQSSYTQSGKKSGEPIGDIKKETEVQPTAAEPSMGTTDTTTEVNSDG